MPRHLRFPVVTFGAILLSLVGYLLVLERGLPYDPFSSRLVRSWVYLNPWDIWSGGYWALLTTVFVHASTSPPMAMVHLLVDLVGLWVFGRRVESALGPTGAFAVLFFGALVASAASLATGAGPSLGATGMVCALIGLLLAARRQHFLFAEMFIVRDHARFLTGWLLLAVCASLLREIPIHPAALLGGWVFGYLAGHAFVSRKPRPSAFVGLTALGVLVLASATWLPWLPEWRIWNVERLLREGQVESAFMEIEPLLLAYPDEPMVLNNAAWRMATLREERFRDGARALELARRACVLSAWNYPSLIDTLAAAFAEQDQWPQALAMQRLALANARELGASAAELNRYEEDLNKILKHEKIRE